MPPELLKLRAPSRARIVDAVYRSLEEAIRSGRMRPGERLVETKIADHLEISRTTVREALLMLERQGYVISKPRRGTFVTRLAREEALDLCYTRALLESFAIRAGYTRIDTLVIERLHDCIEQMSFFRHTDDKPRRSPLDLASTSTMLD